MENKILEHINLFKNNPVFSTLNEVELQQIINISHLKTIQKDELVFSEDQSATFLFLVADGQFSLALHNAPDKIFKKGDLFGEIAIVNRGLRSGAVWAQEDGELICICGVRLFQAEHVDSAVSLKIMRELAVKITNYLRSREQISTEDLIAEGENDFMEFKSTLRWNIYTNKKDKAIEHASLKTIAAFLNSQGGTLLIGVKDDGTLLGLDTDQFQNEDKMLLHLNKLIKDKIGTLHTRFVHTDIETLSDKKVLRVECDSATAPAYLTDGHVDMFYIRTGPATTQLRVSKIFDYIRMRFYEEED